jgi:glycosyltransferase involved in cell wall biosynthesis
VPGTIADSSDARRRRLHVALVVQNAELEIDIRPRAEAEALAQAGYAVTLLGGTRNRELARETVPPIVEIASFPMPRPAGGAVGQVREQGASFALMTRALARLARSEPIDILHASNPPDNVWLALAPIRAAQGRRPRFVFDQHDVAPVLIGDKYGASRPMRAATSVARRLERASFARASLVVFANDEYERRASSHGLLRGPSVIVPNGWSLPNAPASERWRAGASRLLAYVGALGEQDSVLHLVEAVARIPVDDVVVSVAGDGSARAAAERRAAELGVSDRFRWLGWIYNREEIASLVRSADACIAPETDSAFNRLASFVKLVEYMSVGAPIVAHRLPQNERVSGETIEYADDMTADGLAKAISRLLEDRERARRLGEAARKRFVEALAWSAVGGPRLVRAYAETFGNPSDLRESPDSPRPLVN